MWRDVTFRAPSGRREVGNRAEIPFGVAVVVVHWVPCAAQVADLDRTGGVAVANLVAPRTDRDRLLV